MQKHVAGSQDFNYKNPEVMALIRATKNAYDKVGGVHYKKMDWAIQHISEGVLGLKEGPQSASNHIVISPFLEVFDIGHFSKRNGKRVDLFTISQAHALLAACRKRYGFPIRKIGVSEELCPHPPFEMKDQGCFHFEVLLPIMNEESHYMNTV